MPLTYTYADAYLKNHVTEDRETRAIADVAKHGTFAADWTQRLVVLRAYVITCLECQAQPDDLFEQKLKHYREEWETTLAAAQAATPDASGTVIPVFSIPLERA